MKCTIIVTKNTDIELVMKGTENYIRVQTFGLFMSFKSLRSMLLALDSIDLT